MRVAVVDIDNTLWAFYGVFYLELSKINPEIPTPDNWTQWDFWKPYFTKDVLYSVINKIHAEQDRYGVYPDAREFLEFLASKGYMIVIASHRDSSSRDATLRWLQKNKLLFHELHLSYDKTVLFNQDCVVIDDSPLILEKAQKKNLLATGIEFAWNRGNGFKLFKSLTDIANYLSNE